MLRRREGNVGPGGGRILYGYFIDTMEEIIPVLVKLYNCIHTVPGKYLNYTRVKH